MKKHLLPQNKQYKANLHTHSYVSDGYHTPEEYKELYMAQGYSIIAYTDHEFLKDQSHLCDENFVAINGYEYAITKPVQGRYNDKPTCHLNLWAKDPTNLSHVCFNPARKPKGVTEQEAMTAPHYGDYFQAEYSVECINHIISEANKHGFMVCYNHPYWSMEDFEVFSKYEGCMAIEIYNSGRGSGNYEFTTYIYDMLLRMGKKLFPIAADDVHKIWPDVKYHKYAFGGCNMIAAKSLTYSDVIAAIENGDMYATVGGVNIYEIYVEDNVLTLNFEPCEAAFFRTHNRRGKFVFDEQAVPITTASFELDPEDKYVYAYIKTYDGRWAVTRPYYADELF